MCYRSWGGGGYTRHPDRCPWMIPPLPHLHLHVLDLLRTGAKVLQDHVPLALGNVLGFLFLLVVDLRRHREEFGGVKLVELTKDEIAARLEGAAHFVLGLAPPGAE